MWGWVGHVTRCFPKLEKQKYYLSSFIVQVSGVFRKTAVGDSNTVTNKSFWRLLSPGRSHQTNNWYSWVQTIYNECEVTLCWWRLFLQVGFSWSLVDPMVHLLLSCHPFSSVPATGQCDLQHMNKDYSTNDKLQTFGHYSWYCCSANGHHRQEKFTSPCPSQNFSGLNSQSQTKVICKVTA